MFTCFDTGHMTKKWIAYNSTNINYILMKVGKKRVLFL